MKMEGQSVVNVEYYWLVLKLQAAQQKYTSERRGGALQDQKGATTGWRF
jgi:hypothetical protein